MSPHSAPPAVPLAPPAPLLAGDEAPPVRVENEGGRSRAIILCDHASRAVPRALDGLGLPDDELARHIGWDIGAAAVSLHLARLLDAPAVLAGYSRLVIDLNRAPDCPTLMPAVSDGTSIPGNAHLDEAARAQRMRDLFHPYHDRIAGVVARRMDGGVVPALLSIHSFTPEMAGFRRPWHVGVLWNRDPRLALPLLEDLQREPGLVVGDNQPYSARDSFGYTIRHHADRIGLPSLMVEIRQDLIADEAGAMDWAERLGRLIAPLLERPEVAEARVW